MTALCLDAPLFSEIAWVQGPQGALAKQRGEKTAAPPCASQTGEVTEAPQAQGPPVRGRQPWAGGAGGVVSTCEEGDEEAVGLATMWGAAGHRRGDPGNRSGQRLRLSPQGPSVPVPEKPCCAEDAAIRFRGRKGGWRSQEGPRVPEARKEGAVRGWRHVLLSHTPRRPQCAGP